MGVRSSPTNTMSVLDISGAHSTSRLLCRQDATRHQPFSGSPPYWGNPATMINRDGSRLGSSLIRQTWDDIGVQNTSGTVPHHSVSQMTYLREIFLRNPSPGIYEVEYAYVFSSPGKTSFTTSVSFSAAAPSGSQSYWFPIGPASATDLGELMNPHRISGFLNVDIAWWLKPGRYDLDYTYDYRVSTWSSPGVPSGRTLFIKSSAWAVISLASTRRYTHHSFNHSGGSGSAFDGNIAKVMNYPHAAFYLYCPYYISYDNTTSFGLMCSDEITLTRNWP